MSLVFAVEVELKSLTIRSDVIYTPSLLIKISDNEETIFPWEPEEESQSFDINKTYQIMVSTDLFNAIKSWPITFSVAMRKDQIITGSSTYEFRPMLANALALCGRSKSKQINAILKDKNHKEAGRLNLVATIEYIPGNEHTQTVEVIASQPIKVRDQSQQAYQPKMESMPSSETIESTEISQSDVSVHSINSSSTQNNNNNSSSGVTDNSLLQGHSNFKSASQTNRSRLSTAQKTLHSTTKSTTTFTNDFEDEE